MNLSKGTVVGKYRLEAPLAQGGMGAVWMAKHIRLGTPVAVKFLAPALAGSRKSLARFEREAHAATVIQSPHVIQVHDFGVEGETPYLVMELLHGENLAARLQRHKRLSLDEAARILIQVGKALRRAHAAGIVHRDIKPGNLFLAYDDDEEIVKILDFGIAKTTDTPVPEQTEPGTMLGSPNYMSPEQAAGDKTVDHRSDLWSMAVVLYQAVTGELPFQGHTMGNVLKKVFIEAPPRVADIAPDLPAELDDFFQRALAKKRHERFQHIDEMVLAFVAVAAPDQSIPPPSLRYASRRGPQAYTDSQEPCCSEPTPRSREMEEHVAGLREELGIPTVRLGPRASEPPPAEVVRFVEIRVSGPAAGDDTEDTPPPQASPRPPVGAFATSSPPSDPAPQARPSAPSLATSMPDATPSGVTSTAARAADTDRDLSNSVTLHKRAAGRRRLASMLPWLVVAAMLAVPLFFALFRSADGVTPERAGAAVIVGADPGAAVGGAPRVESPGLAPSVSPAPTVASPAPTASAGVGAEGGEGLEGLEGLEGGDEGRAAEAAQTADPATGSAGAKAARLGGADGARSPASAAEALSEGDVYDEPPAGGAPERRHGKSAASSPEATSGPPKNNDARSPKGAPTAPEKRWF